MSAAIFRELALLSLVLLSSCTIQVREAPVDPEPSCRPGNIDVVVILAPEVVEIPECTEIALDVPELNNRNRQWCCWKSKAPSIEGIAARKK